MPREMRFTLFTLALVLRLNSGVAAADGETGFDAWQLGTDAADNRTLVLNPVSPASSALFHVNASLQVRDVDLLAVIQQQAALIQQQAGLIKVRPFTTVV